MKKLFCPWRAAYANDTGHSKTEHTTPQECVFCLQFAQTDDVHNFILKRGTYCLVILNRYPYNAGHLMVLPLAHVDRLHKLDAAARTELMELTSMAAQIVEKKLACHGINIGMNIGKAAGAGIPSHLHMHVLPRFHGDTNFLPILGETKQIAFDLTEIYTTLKPEFDAVRDA